MLIIPGTFSFIPFLSLTYYSLFLKEHKLKAEFRMLLKSSMMFLIFLFIPSIVCINEKAGMLFNTFNEIKLQIYMEVLNIIIGPHLIAEKRYFIENYS